MFVGTANSKTKQREDKAGTASCAMAASESDIEMSDIDAGITSSYDTVTGSGDGSTSTTKGTHSRKRRRSIFQVHSQTAEQSWRRLSNVPFDWQIHQPDLAHFTQLLGGLLLTTCLCLASGTDAENQCISHEEETYSLLDLVDDDNFRQTYKDDLGLNVNKCKRMFRLVLLPTGIVTWVLGLLCLFLIHRFNRRRSQIADNLLRLVQKLLLLLIPLVLIQIYNISAILLSGGPLLKNIKNFDFLEEGDNPFQNLAAVDQYGHMGLNANLFYTVWISLILSFALFYQATTASVRLGRISKTNSEQNMLRSTSWGAESLEESNRYKWYKSLYRLRLRTGFWVAALLSTLTIVASAQYFWTHVLWTFALKYSDAASYRTVCHIVSEHSNLPSQLCGRTVGSWLAGVICASLCATAVGMHLAGRYTAYNHSSMELPVWERILVENRLPLRTELVLSVLLSVLLGVNAGVCTGVQGPAATVGTLYYSSWLAFLCCLRISLGCLEELHNLDDAEALSMPDAYLSADKLLLTGTHSNGSADTDTTGDPDEHDRKPRVRRYFFLAVFSLVCGASAWDAAYNSPTLNRIQRYMMIAPLIVACISGLHFFLCLKLEIYTTISRNYCLGALSSFLCFGICLSVLIPTMHSDDSWAVNGIGEILNANLYYFTWASILSAGIQMMSYGKTMLNIKKGDTMSLVWIGIGKTSFVILGASLHVWHTIADNCGFEEIQSGAVTFCSRTVLAIVIALAGMLVSFLVVCGRAILLACPMCKCHRLQTHVELVLSLFCVFLFGSAVAMITCIGGPGQSVGDLFYSTWLSFVVSIGIFITCYDQLKAEDGASETLKETMEEGESKVGSAAEGVMA